MTSGIESLTSRTRLSACSASMSYSATPASLPAVDRGDDARHDGFALGGGARSTVEAFLRGCLSRTAGMWCSPRPLPRLVPNAGLGAYSVAEYRSCRSGGTLAREVTPAALGVGALPDGRRNQSVANWNESKRRGARSQHWKLVHSPAGRQPGRRRYRS